MKEFDIVHTVHRNQFYKQPARCTFCMYLFYNLFATLHVSNDCFVHHQQFINLLYLQLCTNRANVPNCTVLRLELTVRPWGSIKREEFRD